MMVNEGIMNYEELLNGMILLIIPWLGIWGGAVIFEFTILREMNVLTHQMLMIAPSFC